MATNEFQRLLLQNAAFAPPCDIVSAIPEKTRTLRIPNAPHSIAEELWHIVFWQDHFLRCARREGLIYPRLHLQNAFWVQVTRDLPWCWKPTTSPTLFARGTQFDPRSRCFAFDDDRLVGYMSFTGHGDFVSLGYPWVLPGYEGELQEKLYDAVYCFAAGPEHGGRTFAQRLRQQWKAPAKQSSVGVELDCRDESNLAKSIATSSAKNPSDACRSRLFFPPFCWPARL
jgi:hypothetical protein